MGYDSVGKVLQVSQHLELFVIGFEITGPIPDLIFTSTPIPGSGVTISLYRIAASTS